MIQQKTEGPRGCGTREPGGFYLVTEGAPVKCGLLPAHLLSSYLPTRAPSWHTLDLVLNDWVGAPKPCPKKECTCGVKAYPDTTPALLMWVGMGYYKTVERFEDEAGRMGISRRISRSLALSGNVGTDTFIMLAHREAGTYIDENGDIQSARQIFSVFQPKRIEYILRGDETETQLQDMEARGITLIELVDPQKGLFDE